MTCEEVRDLLPAYLLDSLDETTVARIRRHLRGCASCRSERDRLEDGIVSLSLATHDEPPPEPLRDAVLGVLADEWREAGAGETPSPRSRPSAGRARWIAAVAAALLIVVAAGWGVAQRNRAVDAAADAASYRTILATLGGRDFRLGALEGRDTAPSLRGQVIVYDGREGWTSWGLVLVKGVPDGELTPTLLAADGRTLVLSTLRPAEGEASAWLVTHDDISAFDRLTLTRADGRVVATAEIREA